jgi:hypothetical protein
MAAKVISFARVYGGRAPTTFVCPVCAGAFLNLVAHAQRRVVPEDGSQQSRDAHLVLLVMES